jgi:hypothetical protein
MRFGNTFTTIRGGIAMMTLLGVLAGIFGLVASVKYHTVDRTWPLSVLLVFMPPVVFFLACLPTLAFCIRIEEGRVKHLLLDRFVLSDFPLVDFRSMEIWKKPWAAVIVFTENRSIRFFGAHLGVIGSLRAALEDGKKEKANQPSEPTPPSVTDRAAARSAPAGGVAHL